MLIVLVQALGQAVVASIMLGLVDQLGQGALNGVLAGASIGAVVWSVNTAPDALGRIMLLGIVLTLLGLFFTLFRIISFLPDVSMGAIIASFQDRSGEIGQIVIQGGQWTLWAAVGGALLGAISVVPGEAFKGAVIGTIMGALLGAVLHVILTELGVQLAKFLFQGIVGLLTWGFLAALGGR